MRKGYSFFLSLIAFFFAGSLKAQVTLTTPVPTSVVYVSDTDPGVVIFGIRNTNSSPIVITDLASYNEVGGAGIYSLWYHPTAVTGIPPAVTSANGWIKLCPSGTVNPTSNAVIPTISGLNLIVPPNTTYRLALEGPVHGPYYGTSGSTGDLFSEGGLLLYAQGNVNSPTYAGVFPSLSSSFTPRSFYGSITFSNLSACTDPPTAGTAISSVTISCSGVPFNLCLSGNNLGDGITYQWQSSVDNVNWSDIGVSSVNSSFMTSQAVSTYYRCAVKCGTGNPVYSASIYIPATSGMSGTFTINNGQPTGGGNFQTFGEAVNSMISCGGINGPVVFNVVPGSGPYNEQVVIPQIGGASAVNTITFNGNDAIITAAPVTADRHIIRLDGADYVVIKKLNILVQSGSTFGWGIHLTNGADYNIVDSCTIDISAVTSTTQSNSAGIVASGSTTSVTTDGSASYNKISNNTIIGAYQGVIINGATGSLNAVQNIITKNLIRDFYAVGVELTDNNGSVVSGNDINRATRTAVTTFTGIELGSGNINCVVDGNRVHDTHNAATTQSGTAYGIYSTACDAPAGSENKITNNLVFNFNSGTGTQYGLYNAGSDGVRYYHNTIVLDHPASTAGITRGFYQTTAASNIEIKNNIVYISRGGTGVKYCLYFGTTTSSLTSNNNILYNTASAGTNGVGSFGTAGSSDLAAWQTANGGIYDQQSLSLDPQFVSPATGDYTPGNTLANNTGVYVGVDEDILGNVRSTATPDAGAYEFSFLVAGTNMGAEALVTPDISATGCYSASETIVIKIRNNGSSTINFATNPVTVTVNVTGAVTQTLTTTLNSGTLASDATMDVTMPTALNMSTAGVYTFNAFTSVTGDTNPADDAMLPAERTKEILNAGIAIATPDVFCVSSNTGPVLSTDGSQIGYSSLQWQQSTTTGSGFTDIPGAATVPHALAPLTQTMYYRLVATCNGNTHVSSETSVTFVDPQLLSTTPGTRCGPGAVVLGASSEPGTNLNWYEAATGGVVIATGNSFTTPLLTTSKTYYVTASLGGGSAITGMPAAITTTSSGSGTTNFGLVFDVLAPFTLQTVTIYPVSATGASGTVTIDVVDGTGAVVHTATFNVTGTATPNVQPQTVALNFDLQPGTNYKLRPGSFTGISGLLFEPSAGAPGGNYGYPFEVPGVVSINTSTLTAPPANTVRNDLYYYFYNWQISTGCESIRTPVTATVNAGPAFSVVNDTTICNEAITALSVTSNVADFDSYVWSPVAGLFTDAAATIPYTGGSAATVYIKTATPDVHKYYITANNSSTLCSGLDSVSVTVLPAAISINATKVEFCLDGSATLSLPAGEYGEGLQWYSSPDGIAYSPIAGATSATYTTPTLTSTTYYKLEILNSAGATCLQDDIEIVINNPQVISTAPGSRCSPGAVTLGATASPGMTLNWYDSPTSFSPVGTGNTFVTPSLLSTSTYYVSASAGGGSTQVANHGLPTVVTTTQNSGLLFDLNVDAVLNSVDVYTTTGSGDVVITLYNSAGTLLYTSPTFTVTTGSLSTPQTLTLNWAIPAGTNYRILVPVHTPSLGYHTGSFPIPLGNGVGNVTSGATATGTTTLNYFIYNMTTTVGCEGSRTPVTATINAPNLAVQEDTVVCNNAVTPLSVTSGLANFDSYTWSPLTGLFTDAAATIPYTGGSTATVYVKTATAGAFKYFVNASNSSTTCGNIDSVTVTVLPGSLTITATRPDICGSGSTELSIPPGEYGTAIQWFTSPDGVTYSPVGGANSITYTTPTLTANTYYKVEIRNGAGTVCLQPTITINVGVPQLLTTTSAVRCGPGTVTLAATSAPAGTTVNWYESATGGSPVGTGTSFVTPVLSATTTYYAASAFGNTILTAGRLAPASATSLAASPRGIQFNATQVVRLKSVKVFSTTADGGTGTIELRDASGTVIGGPVSVSWGGGGTTASPVPYVLNLDIDIPIGTGHRLLMATRTGGSIAYETSNITGTWPTYSTSDGSIDLTASLTSATGTSTTAYYYFYDWEVVRACESARAPVIATINTAPGFAVSPDTLICNDAIVPLSVESNPANFDSYIWSPLTGLFTDAAATIPYTGGSTLTLYTKTTSAGIHKYYITANNSLTSCAGLDSISVTVLPASLSIDATKAQICGSGTTTLSLPPGEYGNALQWYSSLDGVAYSPIAGATSATYNTPTLTATTYYKAEIKNGAGAICLQPAITISVGTPDIVTTTSGVRCDPGTVTIGAVAGPAGATVNWYESATGGLPVGTGTSFTTPVLPSTTTYYAASSFGFSTINTGKLAPDASATGTTLTTYGQIFTLTQRIVLNSVQVFSTTGTAITVSLYNSTGATQLQTSGSVAVVAGSSPHIPLGWVIEPGTYRLAANGMTGPFLRDGVTTPSVVYPIALGTVGRIDGYHSSITGSLTTGAAYYYLYNWSISTGCESARVPVEAVINGTITIDADPVDRSLCSTGQSVTFAVTASGAISDYQWRKGGVDLPGATSSTYTIPSVAAGDVGDYDVVISGPCSTVTSNKATLTIDPSTVITADPVSQSACLGGTATFSVAANGAGSLGYQWRKGGGNIPGAYGPVFTITNISAADIASYDVIVTGTCGQIISAAASLTLLDATSITTQPTAQIACEGSNVTFTAAATGSGTVSYQWRKGGVNLPGATSSTYTITGVVPGNAGIYDVIITGGCGSVTSAVATLTVNPATIITVQPLGQSVCIGNAVTFTVSAAGSGTLSYQWRKGGVNLPGATAATYTINAVAAGDIADYDVIVTAGCGAVTSATASLLVSTPGSWIGVQNANWNNAANWCGGIPTPATDVIIPSSAPHMPVLSGSGSARNITINNGATLTVTTGGVLNLYADITGSGTFTPALGSIVFKGVLSQIVPAFTASHVIMDGTGGFTLAGNTAITGTLTLNNGHITLGAYNLSLGSGSFGSVSSHIITNGNGNVIVAGLAPISGRTIPVGISAASYTPVVLTTNPGHVTDDLTVRVVEHVLTNGVSGSQLTEFVVDRTWLIDEMTPGGSDLSITLQWNESDELVKFGRNESYVMQYTGGAWMTGTETVAMGANPYTQTRAGVTSLSAFAVQTEPIPDAVTGIFPNPTNSILNVLVRTNAPESLTISIFDPSGKLVMTRKESVGYGGTVVGIDVSRLSAGTYILKVSIPRDREFLVRRFVKVN